MTTVAGMLVLGAVAEHLIIHGGRRARVGCCVSKKPLLLVLDGAEVLSRRYRISS